MILNLSVENLTQSHYIVKVRSHREITNVKAMVTTDLLNANIFTDLKEGNKHKIFTATFDCHYSLDLFLHD